MTKPNATLLEKMTAQEGGELKFTPEQVDNLFEILIPRMATSMPGLPKGFTCTVDKTDDGWVITVKRPK